MKGKRFIIRKSLINPDDLTVKEDDEQSDEITAKMQEAKKAYVKFVGSSKALAINKPVKAKRGSSKNIEIPAVQCGGTTQSNHQCANKTRNISGYCHHH